MTNDDDRTGPAPSAYEEAAWLERNGMLAAGDPRRQLLGGRRAMPIPVDSERERSQAGARTESDDTPPEDEHSDTQRNASQRLAEISARQGELLVDAADAETAGRAAEIMAEVKTLESEERACRTALDRLARIRSERQRRGELARHEAQAAARRAAAQNARGLGEDRARAARAVDEALSALADAVARHRDVVFKQSVQLEAAGRRVSAQQPRMVQRAFEHAIAKALEDAGVRDVVELPLLSPREVRPFADGDPAPQVHLDASSSGAS